MAVVIEGARCGSAEVGQTRPSARVRRDVSCTSDSAPARTLTPDSETDPTEARIQRAMNKKPRKPDEPCRFNCGRSTRKCSYYGPPCEERLRIHRSFFGTDAIEREADREDRYADDQREYREP